MTLNAVIYALVIAGLIGFYWLLKLCDAKRANKARLEKINQRDRFESLRKAGPPQVPHTTEKGNQ